ncbi:MAG: L-threonylcarbamoyladenylate synthase [bacterium]|nr:L-threonylcarbamoyladenylate synthase [bacterium]
MKQDIIHLLKGGKVGVIPTDTLYGLVGSALNKETVERINQLKDRSENKSFIILISSLDDLKLFKIQLDEKTQKFLKKIWPNPVSVILPCSGEKFTYLHRGTNSLAFRLPKDQKLLELLQQIGPLVAPSANPKGEPPARTLEEAKNYFSDSVDFYLDGEKLTGQPSTLIKIQNHEVILLRKGAFKLS